jgi:glyoxylase-like metal-dependent hydrolase (beta-lactamase superfamily II)
MPDVTITEIDPGTVRITMPLPWALDHVYCYAFAADDGWSIVDAGLGTDATMGWWESALGELGGRVSRLVVTHYHPDHIGATARLAELTGAGEIVQGRDDWRLSAVWEADDGEEFAGYLAAHGMPSAEAERSAEAEGQLGVRLIEPTRLLDEGDVVDLGGERWTVLVLPGHADGHIALLGTDTRRLIGGDVLLDEITPNVGRWPDTAHDPLGRYLQTLDRIAQIAPPLVLPGHGPLITDAAGRAREIARHHDERLDAAHDALVAGAETAFDAAQLIWRDEPLGFHEQRFALVEAISHLERLAALGRAEELSPGRWRALATAPNARRPAP